MAKKAFDMMMEGLEDAIAYSKGDASRGRAHYPVSAKAVRAATKLTQAEFAKTYHLPIGTVRDWEQERSQPDVAARVLLSLIEIQPATVAKLVEEAEKKQLATTK